MSALQSRERRQTQELKTLTSLYADSVHLHEANSVTLIKENEQVIEGESKTEHAIQGEQLKEKQKDKLIAQECKMVIDNHQRGVKRNKSSTPNGR